MKQRLTPSGTVVLGTVFAALTLCCSFYQPHVTGAVYEAVPAHASFAHRSANLGELRNSPLYSRLNQMLGAGNSMDALLKNHEWIHLAAPAEIVITSFPMRRHGETKVWAAISWVGWRSPWLRWKLEHARTEGFTFIGKHSVWPVWKYETPDITRGSCLTLSLTDNLLIACISEDPGAITLFLDTYDRRIPSFSASHERIM